MTKTKKLSDADIINLGPQQRLVYDYLMTGRQLSRQVAINTLGVQEVTTRISELNKLGLDIQTEWKRDFGGTRYKAYWVEVGVDA
ncbi:helix-turn-helix domain-containing protein [Mesorhizobium sp. B2-8-3]|uniref:helix-turn-helix domain-containing protein n=1 Tax=Mesorhizobium sp. B2-8-3 TaxID=2589905 RepID=UPI0015E45877|nr:helix-turn-helix domain-containing protein [Mesorhizobium sp. B2-8-3]